MTPDQAETTALAALNWIVGQEDLWPVFLGATGAAVEDVRDRAADPEFLASLVDFILMDDAWVLDCAEACGWPPERLAEARAALPGGALPNWT